MSDKDHYTLEALLSLNRMIQSQAKYPHGDCPTVAPTMNICPTCPTYSFCHAREDFKHHVMRLEKGLRG